MTTTTYYNLNIVEGTDIVNPLIVDNPNYEKIDEVMHDNAVSGVTLATEITNATVHSITRENSDCAVIRFIATSVWKAGDTITVDGVPVTALLPSGETLPDGAYVINANVLCILTGTNLTIYAERKKTENANEIAYNDTTVGAELVRLDVEVNEANDRFVWKPLIENYTPTNALNGNVDVTIPDDAKEVLLTVTLNQKLFLVTELVPASKAKGYIVCSYYSSATEYGSASFQFSELKRCTRITSAYKSIDNTALEYFSIYYR